jgi:hypothetical protein
MDALSKRNLATHTYDEALAEKFTREIIQIYVPVFKALYEKLVKK